uniref:N(6)-L-threonylcarbamoyladenine synthase n=1 Tax=Knipowitschia caucasica TaxID=637954 RepID=A0AAV2JU06_KNICA
MLRTAVPRLGWLSGGCARRQSRSGVSALVLGIETSCDETGAAVMDADGRVLGESLHSQKDVHLRSGGIIPAVAQQLHRLHVERVVSEALGVSGVSPQQLSAVASTVRPGLALSLGVGLDFSRRFVRLHRTPFIPVHHMEAHALTVRMLDHVDFPFLVLLISGGHALLAVARAVDDFLLLGQTLDEAPGDTLDKVARRLSLLQHPLCSLSGGQVLSGGQALEVLARTGDRTRFRFRTPMGQSLDCNFSFAGFRNQVNMTIKKQELEEGVGPGALLSCVCDVAAAVQHTVAAHLSKRTHRAVLFCKLHRLLPDHNPALYADKQMRRHVQTRPHLPRPLKTKRYTRHEQQKCLRRKTHYIAALSLAEVRVAQQTAPQPTSHCCITTRGNAQLL